jgi:hypothetical protein
MIRGESFGARIYLSQQITDRAQLARCPISLGLRRMPAKHENIWYAGHCEERSDEAIPLLAYNAP